MNIKDILKAGGGPSNLSKLIGIHHTAIIRWKAVPVNRLAVIEKITGIPREELRPDIFRKGNEHE